MKLIPRIETDKFQKADSEELEELQYLIIYDPQGTQLAKSDNKPLGSNLEIMYEDLLYLTDSLGRISIGYDSIINKFKVND